MLAAYCNYKEIKTAQNAAEDTLVDFELRKCPKPSLTAIDGKTGIKKYIYPPGTVLIQTIAASICGSDLFGSNLSWRRPTDVLNAMQGKCGGSGHEAIGRIIDIVPPSKTKMWTKNLSIGQKVLAMPPAYLTRVSSVRETFRKETGMLVDKVFQEEMGAFCEFFISHACVCLPLSESVPNNEFDWRWYVMAQPLGTIVHACEKLGCVINRNVAVVGQGQNGLMITQMLANMGARRIIALDLLEERLVHAKKNKATHIVKVANPMNMDAIKANVEQITDGAMCDISIDMVGHQNKTIDLCSKLTREGGDILLFGLPPAKRQKQMSIHYDDLTRNLHYICSHSPKLESFTLALELLEQGRFDPSRIFTHEIPFHRFSEAYKKAYWYEDGVIKILLSFPDSMLVP